MREPPPGPITVPTPAEWSYGRFAEECLEELAAKSSAHAELWGFGSTYRWDLNLETGLLVFSEKDGRAFAASAQVVGVHVAEDKLWSWGWDQPGLPDGLKRNALLLRDWGRRLGIGWFDWPGLTCEVGVAWALTAVACRLAGASGAYSAPASHQRVFVTFGPVSAWGPGVGDHPIDA